MKSIDAPVIKRGIDQEPMLYPKDAVGVEVAWTLNKPSWRRLVNERNLQRGEPLIKPAEIVRLWKTRDQFRELDPLRYAPVAWAEMEHRILWLEQAATAGAAYEAAAHRTLSELNEWNKRTEDRAEQAMGSPSLFRHAAIFSDPTMIAPSEKRVRSEVLGAFLEPVAQPTNATGQEHLAKITLMVSHRRNLGRQFRRHEGNRHSSARRPSWHTDGRVWQDRGRAFACLGTFLF